MGSESSSHVGNSESAFPLPQTGLLFRLRQLADALPAHIPIGGCFDPIGQVVSNDIASLLSASGDPDLDPYEVIDPILNNAFGYNKTHDDLVAMISRGPFGIHGLCDWIEGVISTHRVDPVLFEPRLERLTRALLTWCVFCKSSLTVPT